MEILAAQNFSDVKFCGKKKRLRLLNSYLKLADPVQLFLASDTDTKKMNVLQTLEHIFTFLLLLANRFPFVAVSIAFAVNKEVSEQKTQNKTTVEPFTKQLENASVPPW